MYKVIKSFIFSALNDIMTKMFVYIEASNSFELFLSNEVLFKTLFNTFISNRYFCHTKYKIENE